MKISSEVREHWTQYLQGQLTVEEHEVLGRRLVAEPDLAAALAADANVHQLLLDHFATKPALMAVLSSLPERSFGKLNDAQFVARCLEAVGSATPALMANHTKSRQLEVKDAPAVLLSDSTPPVFDLNNGITFEEPNSIPPIAVEPPPVCQTEPATAVPVRSTANRWVLILSIATTALLTATGTWWVLQGPTYMADATASPEDDRGALPARPQGQNDDPAARGVEPFDQARILNPVDRDGAEADGNEVAQPRQPRIGEAAADGGPMLAAADPNRERFPQVIRGAAEEEPNFIKDGGEEIPVGPLHAKLPVGQLVAGRDAVWEAEPEAWGTPAEENGNAAASGRSIRLTQGAAQLVLDNGLKVGMQAPAAFQFVSPTRLRLIDGMFLVEPTSADAPLDWMIETDCFDVTPATPARFFVTTSADFGTGVEVLEGAGRLTPRPGLGEPVSLGSDGFFSGHFLPADAGAGTKPGAAALAHRDGSFLGRIVAFQTPLLISSSEVFGATLQIIVQRLREAPANFETDWSHVVKQLEQLNAKKRNRPGLRHEVLYSGDLLPAFPELQADLGRGIPLPKGPLDMDQIRQFAGQININGQLFNLDNMNELQKIQQELANDLTKLRAQQEQMQGNRGRRNAADPDFMAQQLLIQQMQQIEMILRMAQGFQNGNLPGMLPGAAPPVAPAEPVVASFANLLTPEGQQDRAAMVEQLQRVLEDALEDEAQRASRLEKLREKLHQP